MSKGLEALKRIKSGKLELTFEQFYELFDIVEKELKALEILKKHEMVRYIEWFGLTKEECDLLKEVLL